MSNKPIEGYRSNRVGLAWRSAVIASATQGRVARQLIVAVTLVAATSVPAWSQSEDELAKRYSKDAMQQALQTREQYDHYGLRFDSDKATLQPGAEALLDDIATALKNFPEWGLRIVGHTDATGDPNANQALALARAEAIKAALVERGVDQQRLLSAGLGEEKPVASNETAEGRALNRRVELVRFTDSVEAKKLLKAMSDYVGAQTAISFGYDANLQVVTNASQKLGLASSGTVALSRPDKIRTTRSGGFIEVESVFDGKTLTLLGKDENKYTQVDIPGTVDQLVTELKDRGLPLPAADLLLTNSYDELMDGVYDLKDLGSGVINGKECDSLAFRKDEVDFQIWVAQGDNPYPCRLVITSTQVAGGPEYSMQIRDWKAGDGAVQDDFVFTSSANAEKINLEDLKAKLGELPGNFIKGDGK